MQKIFIILLAALTLVSCGSSRQSAVSEVAAREIQFPNYPQAGFTYLSFSRAHGYQVNYLASGGRAWLWYPGNSVGVKEDWKRDTVAGTRALCWRHPQRSYNPVTKRSGGRFACQSLELSQKTIIARLGGDPFGLASGAVPYRLNRCKAPDAFSFDRARFGC